MTDPQRNTDEGVQPASSALLRLPVELRLQIYETLYADSEQQRPYYWQGFYLWRQDAEYICRESFPNLAITQVCRLLRSEAVPVLYGKYELVMNFRYLWEAKLALLWLHDADPFVVMSLQGVEVWDVTDLCRARRKVCRGNEVEVDFNSYGAVRWMSQQTSLCDKDNQSKQELHSLVQRFSRNEIVEQDSLKRDLMHLLEDVMAFDKQNRLFAEQAGHKRSETGIW